MVVDLGLAFGWYLCQWRTIDRIHVQGTKFTPMSGVHQVFETDAFRSLLNCRDQKSPSNKAVYNKNSLVFQLSSGKKLQ